jgi:hypothetical protein
MHYITNIKRVGTKNLWFNGQMLDNGNKSIDMNRIKNTSMVQGRVRVSMDKYNRKKNK